MSAGAQPLASRSLLQRFKRLPHAKQRRILRKLAPTREKRQALTGSWRLHARRSQLEPKKYIGWMIVTGRGWGKTRTGAQTVNARVARGQSTRIGLVAQTDTDARTVMVEGPSGLVETAPAWNKPVVFPGKRKVVWPNGAEARWYSSVKPDGIRGHEFDYLWFDEFAHLSNLNKCFDNAMLALRVGKHPQWLATTSPLPVKLLMELVDDKDNVVTTGTSFENRANLPETYYTKHIARYEGTRKGRQEVHGEILRDIPGALWEFDQLDVGRIKDWSTLPQIVSMVVAIDPAVADPKPGKVEEKKEEDLAQTGIIVMGLGDDGHLYVFDDRTLQDSPIEWARAAKRAYDDWNADIYVAEVNQGGALVRDNIRIVHPRAPIRMATAARGKYARAEPVATLYEQGLVHHVLSKGGRNRLKDLEDQMCLFTPDLAYVPNPDRVDALVWGAHHLVIGKKGKARLIA